MHKKEFFEVLKEDLPDDKYKARLLRELEGHWDDCGSGESGEKAEQRLGDPHDFISFYQDVMKKNTSLYLEALFIGLCSLPMILLPFIGNSFTEATENLLAKAALWVLTLAVMGLFYFTFYRWVWARLSTALKIQDHLAKKLMPLLLIPSGYALGLVAILLKDDNNQDYFFLPVIGSYILVQVVAAWKARSRPFGEKETRRISVLSLVFVVAALVALPLASGSPLNDALFALFFFVRVGFFLPFGMDFTLAITTLGVFALFIMTYSLFAVFQRIRTGRGFAWGKALIGLFLFYGFLAPPATSGLIAWELPAVNLTMAWEQEELGLLYRWYRFVTNDGERTYQYALAHSDGSVRITNQADATMEFTTLSLEPRELEWFEATKGMDYVSSLQSGPVDLPEEFTCVDPDAPDDLSDVLVLGGETYCQKFYYKDQLVFSAPVAAAISDVFVTDDGQWLVVHFSEQNWGPGLFQHDSVFAVKLIEDETGGA